MTEMNLRSAVKAAIEIAGTDLDHEVDALLRVIPTVGTMS